MPPQADSAQVVLNDLKRILRELADCSLRGKTKWHQQRIKKPVNTYNTASLQGLIVACKDFVYSLEKAQVLLPYILNALGSNLITRAYKIQKLYPLIIGELICYLRHVWPLLLLVISDYIHSQNNFHTHHKHNYLSYDILIVAFNHCCQGLEFY